MRIKANSNDLFIVTVILIFIFGLFNIVLKDESTQVDKFPILTDDKADTYLPKKLMLFLVKSDNSKVLAEVIDGGVIEHGTITKLRVIENGDFLKMNDSIEVVSQILFENDSNKLFLKAPNTDLIVQYTNGNQCIYSAPAKKSEL